MNAELSIVTIAFMAGIIQAVTGFGGGIVMMMVLPNLFSMNQASSISGAVCIPLAWAIAWRYRKHLNLKKILIPLSAYLFCSTIAIHIATIVDMNQWKPIFCGLLIILSIYFMFFSTRIQVSDSVAVGLICGGLAGLLGGFFGIGGPPMVLYFLAATDSKEEYLGNINGVFAFTTLYQSIARVFIGLLAINFAVMITVGIIGILAGRFVGSKISDKLDVEKMKRIIYVMLAFFGVLTIWNSI